MMLMTDDVAPDCHQDPIDQTRSHANDHDGLRRAMALGDLDIEPFDDDRSEAGTYRLGFTAHDSTLGRPAPTRERGVRARASHGISIEPGATATVESLEFLELSPSIMARLWVATWTLRDELRISAERLLPPRFRGRVCAYVTNIGRAAITLPPRPPLITVEVHFLSEARTGRPGLNGSPHRLASGPSARVLESASRGCAAERGAGATVRIDDLSPTRFALRRAIFIVVHERAGEFRARFAEADIEITGDCPEEAIANPKSLVVATYEDLIDADPDGLDRRQFRQRRVLADLLRYHGAAEV